MIINAKEGYQYCTSGDCQQNCSSTFKCYQNCKGRCHQQCTTGERCDQSCTIDGNCQQLCTSKTCVQRCTKSENCNMTCKATDHCEQVNFLSTNQKHYQDLGSARHQYGISALVTQTSFCEGSSGDLAKRRLFSQANSAAVMPALNQPINSRAVLVNKTHHVFQDLMTRIRRLIHKPLPPDKLFILPTTF